MTAGAEVEFLITKPNASEIKLRARTNDFGFAEAELFGYNTKMAGSYKVQAKKTTEMGYGSQTIFKVYPDALSITQSQIKADKNSVSANGAEKVYVTVVLNDKYLNPIQGHQVKIISSRAEDEIKLISEATSNAQGRSVFEISSRYPGVSVYSAWDVNLGKDLSERIKVVFFEPVKSLWPRGGDFLQGNLLALENAESTTQNGGVAGPVHHFDILIPDEVVSGEASTIKVTAKDVDNNVAKNYVGTILFATPDDENSTLPAEDGEFTFTDQDQGEFTFNLALTLTKLGSQTIQVFDKEDWDILGEKRVEVVSKDSGSTQTLSTSNLKITTPSEGAEFSSRTVSVLGKAEAYQDIKIFDNDVKIGETQSDSEGMFTFVAQSLSDGRHSLYVKGGENVSGNVNITIDATPPLIDMVEISPKGELERDSTYTLKVFSEPNLVVANFLISGVTEILYPSTQTTGLYEATLKAPSVGGEYPIDIILTDVLGNK